MSTFGKTEKLSNKKTLDTLFKKGKVVNAYPLRLLYVESEWLEETSYKVAFGVPKRKFRRAVDRNRIKRLMREAYRLNKHELPANDKKNALMIMYLNNQMPTYKVIENKLLKLMQKFKEQ